MAEHVDSTGQLDDGVPADPPEPVTGRTRTMIVAGAILVVLLSGVAGWLGYRGHQVHAAQAQQELFVQVARQTAVNLTTIDHTDTGAFVQRILESSTGTFHQDFQQRSKPFVDVVTAAQSRSVGTVTEAAVQSADTDGAQVLVAVSVATSIGDAPQGDPRHWRMRISVQKSGDDAKVSNVVFVP